MFSEVNMKKQTYITRTKERTLTYTAGEVASLRIKDGVKTTVRVYDKGYIGVAGRSGDVDMAELEKSAVEALENKVPYPEPEEVKDKRVVDTTKEIIVKSELMKTGEELIGKLSEENPEFIFSGKTVLQDNTEIFMSGEQDYECRRSEQSTYFIFKHRQSASIMDEAYGVSGDKFEADKIQKDVKTLGDAYLNLLPQLEEDEMTVITDMSICSFLIKDFMAKSYCNDSSLLSGKLGEKAFSEKFTVYAEKDPYKKNGAVFFDGEGVVSKDDRVYFVKEGVLTNLLTTRQNAQKYGVENSGTASAPFAAIPAEGAGAMTVECTADSVRDVVGKEKAVFVSMSSGGDMTSSGDVALPVQTSYVYENGKLKGRLPGFTITGNIFDILGKDFMGASDKGIWSTGENIYLVFKAKAVNKQ